MITKKIVFIEGGDKVGKSTLVNNLKAHYTDIGKEVKVISSSEKSGFHNVLDTTNQYLYSLKHQSNFINELESFFSSKSKRDSIVIFDRFLFTTIVYDAFLYISRNRVSTDVYMKDVFESNFQLKYANILTELSELWTKISLFF